MVLADFSENVMFFMQGEIQSFHWANKQAPGTHLLFITNNMVISEVSVYYVISWSIPQLHYTVSKTTDKPYQRSDSASG